MPDTGVFDFYRAPSTLWVEDHLTRGFLTELWGTDIRVLAAGGREGVLALVRGAPPALAGKQVVGLVDRDFSPDNRQAWASPETTILRTPAHELENLLLDFPILSAVSRKDSAQEIEEVARSRAASLKWWMVCKTLLHRMHAELTAHFPAPPSPDTAPTSGSAAADYIVASDYWKEHEQILRDRSPRFSRSYVDQRIAALGDEYERDLVSGEWVRSFSGKEIFRHLRTVMPGLRARARGGTAAENDENAAILIAREMRKPGHGSTSVIAQSLHALRAALRARAGLPP